jgi:tetratricopeptide (TPR) repeat protein
MAYLVYDLAGHLGSHLPALEAGVSVQQDYRATEFYGSTSKALVIYYDPPRCLKVIDPDRDQTLPNRPDLVTQALPLSRLDLILPNPETAAMLPEELFGPEPPRNWCFYFEKAELAQQFGDWDKVIELAQQAFELDAPLNRENAHEVVPFIEGYAHTENWDLALEWTQRAAKLSDKMPFVLCNAWQRIAVSAPDSTDKQLALRQVDDLFACKASGAKQ